MNSFQLARAFTYLAQLAEKIQPAAKDCGITSIMCPGQLIVCASFAQTFDNAYFTNSAVGSSYPNQPLSFRRRGPPLSQCDTQTTAPAFNIL